MLAFGDYAPTLSIPTDTDMFPIAEQGGKKVVVFFPRADRPSCNNETEQFSTLHDEFIAHHTVMIDVSKDTPTKQATFRAKYDLTCKLGADHETSFCEEFGVSDARQKATATRHLVAAATRPADRPDSHR